MLFCNPGKQELKRFALVQKTNIGSRKYIKKYKNGLTLPLKRLIIVLFNDDTMDCINLEEMDKVLQKNYAEGVRRHIDIPDISVYSVLKGSAEKYGNETVIYFMGKKISYFELKKLVDSISASLKEMGVKKGDRISLMLPNIPHFVTMFFAIEKLGSIVVQTNPLYTIYELEKELKDAGAEIIVVMDRDVDKALALYPKVVKKIIVVRVQDHLPSGKAFLLSLVTKITGKHKKIPKNKNIYKYKTLLNTQKYYDEQTINPVTDAALFQYTGGTTGIPKGAVLSHKNLISNSYQIIEWLPEEYKERIKYLAAIPFFHVYGMMTAMLTPIKQGGQIILVPDPRVTKWIVEAINKNKPTAFPAVPTMYHALLKYSNIEKHNLSSIRFCISGSAPLPEELQNRFEKTTGAMIVEGYGLSETSPVTNVNPMDFSKRKLGSIGLAVSNTYQRIMDMETGTKVLNCGEVGELVIKGPQVMLKYWNNEEETKYALRDGWLYTGDIAKMDENGYVYIVDRKKDMIIAGGYNVYPREVEEVLYKHPKVSEAAVVGAKDPHRGETVKAFVVLKENQQATESEIIEFCKQYLSVYKVPKIVEFVKSLPKTYVGKVLKRELK